MVLSWLDRHWLRDRLRHRVRLRFGVWRRNEIWVRSRVRLWIGLGPRIRPGNRWRDQCRYREKPHFLVPHLMMSDLGEGVLSVMAIYQQLTGLPMGDGDIHDDFRLRKALI